MPGTGDAVSDSDRSEKIPVSDEGVGGDETGDRAVHDADSEQSNDAVFRLRTESASGLGEHSVGLGNCVTGISGSVIE